MFNVDKLKKSSCDDLIASSSNMFMDESLKTGIA